MLNKKETMNSDEAMQELRDLVDEYKALSRSAESDLASYRPKPHRALVYNSKKEQLASELTSRRIKQTIELLRDAKKTLE